LSKPDRDSETVADIEFIELMIILFNIANQLWQRVYRKYREQHLIGAGMNRQLTAKAHSQFT
jgi:hypothetical protein